MKTLFLTGCALFTFNFSNAANANMLHNTIESMAAKSASAVDCPPPCPEHLTLSFTSSGGMQAMLLLFSNDGALIKREYLMEHPGQNSFTVNTADLASGNYTYQMMTSQGKGEGVVIVE
ncbi:MAG: hypothetical protein U0T84_10370 [Chitinophagales bacterium]